VLTQAADSKGRIGGLDSQNKLGGGQLVVEVERRGSVRRRDQLKILVDLFVLFLERLELGLLHHDAIHQLLPNDLHLPNNVALLHFLPFVVCFDGPIQVPLDGPAGEIVADGDLPIRLRTLGKGFTC
jgi:hypothetical protein